MWQVFDTATAIVFGRRGAFFHDNSLEFIEPYGYADGNGSAGGVGVAVSGHKSASSRNRMSHTRRGVKNCLHQMRHAIAFFVAALRPETTVPRQGGADHRRAAVARRQTQRLVSEFGVWAFLAFWHFWHFGILAFWHFGILAFGVLVFVVLAFGDWRFGLATVSPLFVPANPNAKCKCKW